MSEFRKDMRKDIGNKKIAIVQSLVEVSGFIANLIDIIDGHSNEIDPLTAELAAKEQDWTPITSVEQVEGLAAGFYELRDIERGVWCPATKKSSGVWQLVIGGAMPVDSTLAASEINDRYREYKLIRAFEPAAPSIPEGAIEKTYMWGGKLGTARDLAGMESGTVQQLAADLIEAQEKAAALEALAKGER